MLLLSLLTVIIQTFHEAFVRCSSAKAALPGDYVPDHRDTIRFFKKMADLVPGDEVTMRTGEVLIVEQYDSESKLTRLWDPRDDAVIHEVAWNIASVFGVSAALIVGYVYC